MRKPPTLADTFKVFNSPLPKLPWLSPLVAEVPPKSTPWEEAGDSAFSWVCFQGNVVALKPQDTHFPRWDDHGLGDIPNLVGLE